MLTIEHSQDCKWWKDWHNCSCGVFDNQTIEDSVGCCEIIPGTFIICGEGGNYCSLKCYERAKNEY